MNCSDCSSHPLYKVPYCFGPCYQSSQFNDLAKRLAKIDPKYVQTTEIQSILKLASYVVELLIYLDQQKMKQDMEIFYIQAYTQEVRVS